MFTVVEHVSFSYNITWSILIIVQYYFSEKNVFSVTIKVDFQ